MSEVNSQNLSSRGIDRVVVVIVDGHEGNGQRSGPGVLQSERDARSPAGATPPAGVRHGSVPGRGLRHVVLLRPPSPPPPPAAQRLHGGTGPYRASSHDQSAQSHGDGVPTCRQRTRQGAVWRQYGLN